MAGQTSKENGKKGGRPKGYVALEAEKARQLITERVSEYLEPIISALIKKAEKGDIRAVKELFDRSWGKSIQTVEASINGETPKFILTEEQRYKIAKNIIDRYEAK